MEFRMLIKHVHTIPTPDHTWSQLNFLKTSQPILPVVFSHQSPVIHLKHLTNTVYLVFPTYATCAAHPVLHNFIAITISCEE